MKKPDCALLAFLIKKIFSGLDDKGLCLCVGLDPNFYIINNPFLKKPMEIFQTKKLLRPRQRGLG
jgi:hypothetical protein